MKVDPALCKHADIRRTARVETLSVPQLSIEQLFLRVKVTCRDCGAAFVPRTALSGFSTDDVGVVDDEVLVPLDRPPSPPAEGAEEAAAPQSGAREPKTFIH